jgi:hypothetical protein
LAVKDIELGIKELAPFSVVPPAKSGFVFED